MASRTFSILIGAVLAAVIIGPVSIVVIASLSDNIPLVERFSGTLDHYRALLDPYTFHHVVNTAWYAGGSLIVGVLIAVLAAFLTERTDLPYAWLISLGFFSTMAVPLVVQSIGWVLLLSPRIGLMNVWLRMLLHLGSEAGPINVYSVWGMILATGVGVSSTAYAMLSPLMRMNPEFEEAGRVSGASGSRTFGFVTLPLLLPGFYSVGIYLLLILIQSFDIALVLGMPANFTVLSVRIFLSAYPEVGLPSYGLSSAYGVLLVFLAGCLLFSYLRTTRMKERFQVIGGRGFRFTRISLGVWKYPSFFVLLAILIFKLAPIGLVIWTSFLPYYQPPSSSAIASLTLSNYARAAANPQLWHALGNTLLLGTLAPTIAVSVSCIVVWFVRRARGTGALDFLAFIPVAIPQLLIGLALLLLFVRTPFHGLIWTVLLGHIIVSLAYSNRTLQPAFSQLHRDLEEAATVSGSTPLDTFRSVAFPLLAPAILGTWLWISINSMRDLQIPLMLSTSKNVVMSVLVYQQWIRPNVGDAAVISVLLMILVAPMYLIANFVQRTVAGGSL